MQPCLLSKPVEFHGFKIRVVEMFPYPEKFDCIAVSYPVPDQIIGTVRIFVPRNIGHADIIFIIDCADGNFIFEHMDLSHYCTPV